MDSDWDIIYSYTRKQAIHDGILIDISKIAEEKGFTCSFVLTIGVFASLTKNDELDKEVFFIILEQFLEKMKISNFKGGGNLYEIIFKNNRYWMELGIGDEMEPAITIMFPEEY